MKLYVYDHCPFCVRARMIFGLKNIAVEEIVLLNDDEATPVGLVGKKVVPILQKDDGSAMAESLDIVRYIDEHYGEKLLREEIRAELTEWMNDVGAYYNRLLMPRFIRLGLAEYATQSAVDYFVSKKTESIGDFAENLQKSPQYIEKLHNDLARLESLIKADNGANGALSLEDIVLFPMLRNLTCVKGVIFPPKVQAYITAMSQLSRVPLYSSRAL
ncbi:glutaredoxin 2 [Caviibacterium pharyngocola]|uniref:Glutaredoxin, GrxB family n=1 Tax=Caviibacterium pharyngocola TaxID=28159 RepID=A0A2M8RSN4_9PAST|nr:glutaredoxin 2 [Caviibacterium pharyngocola]PJG81899.1 glutaredoxin, GrxB family [Caviibacterium pharyngocola]